jgi:hypothetical protein
MALPKKVNDKVAALALREAAKDVDGGMKQGPARPMKMPDPEFHCPKCGYEGLESEFKEQEPGEPEELEEEVA